MSLHIKRSRFSMKAVVRFNCPDCKANSRRLSFFQEWYGWNSTCINCGRQWSDGEWMPLDFARGIRKRNINAAKQLWRKLSDVEVLA